VAAGIKPSGNPDVGMLVCDSEAAVSAARFTSSGTPAAPVLVSRERCQLNALRVVLANSGCANAATGGRGLDDAAKTQGAAAVAAGVDPTKVAVASTGAISHYMPMDAVVKGILDARTRLGRDGDGAFQQAIQTTDAFEKRANLEVRLPSGTVRLNAQCKGAGMISPRFATMLCFVQTDAQLTAETAELLLGVCVKRSFDRASVDGQLSTNDTAILMCSGASGVRVEPHSEDELRFGEALDALLRQLAITMVADGEGAGRCARVVVRGGHLARAEATARAVANSPLVKAALHGGDPNWGRIVQAVGAALPGTAPLAVDISIEGALVCSAGAAIPFDERALARAVRAKEVEYEIGLPGEGAETEVFFSDLSHEYVTINADYTT
jgi:glutamate N-acetyltransferase/amino-acid N-acetyltransferase